MENTKVPYSEPSNSIGHMTSYDPSLDGLHTQSDMESNKDADELADQPEPFTPSHHWLESNSNEGQYSNLCISAMLRNQLHKLSKEVEESKAAIDHLKEQEFGHVERELELRAKIRELKSSERSTIQQLHEVMERHMTDLQRNSQRLIDSNKTHWSNLHQICELQENISSLEKSLVEAGCQVDVEKRKAWVQQKRAKAESGQLKGELMEARSTVAELREEFFRARKATASAAILISGYCAVYLICRVRNWMSSA